MHLSDCFPLDKLLKKTLQGLLSFFNRVRIYHKIAIGLCWQLRNDLTFETGQLSQILQQCVKLRVATIHLFRFLFFELRRHVVLWIQCRLCLNFIHGVGGVLARGQLFNVGKTEVGRLSYFHLSFFGSQNSYCDFLILVEGPRLFHTKRGLVCLKNCILQIFDIIVLTQHRKRLIVTRRKHFVELADRYLVVVLLSILLNVSDDCALCLEKRTLLANRHELTLRVLSWFLWLSAHFCLGHKLLIELLRNASPLKKFKHFGFVDNLFIHNFREELSFFEQFPICLKLFLSE